ncbi:MAG: nitroreductase/quinone reductase family protein [Mycobacterium sp.]
MRLYDTKIEALAGSRFGAWLYIHVFTPIDRFLLTKTKGRVGTPIGTRFFKDTVILSCRGARSGLKREVPLLSTSVGEEFVVVASRGGAIENPAGYHNLKANPTCTLMVRGQSFECTAREASGEERDRYWRAAVENYSGFARYQTRTNRTIPVIVLTPSSN